MNIEQCMKELTLEEKISMLEGADMGFTSPVPRLGIPRVLLADGPHGIRVVKGTDADSKEPYTMQGEMYETTALPCEAAMAAYNQAEGEYLCQNKRLLSDVLREEIGFDGVVLPEAQLTLIHELAKTGSRIIVVTQCGSAVEYRQIEKEVQAVGDIPRVAGKYTGIPVLSGV